MVAPLGFGFSHPWMLMWMAAAAAPLVIHLWNRRVHHEVPWAAIEFLAAAIRKDRSRLQLKQWILLAVRVLAMTLLAVALAEPFFESIALNRSAIRRTHRVFVVDGSFSMGYMRDTQSLFALAKEMAIRMVRESREGDGFSLVLMSARPKVIVGSPSFDSRDVVAEIDRLKLPHGDGDLAATLSKIEELIDRAERDRRGLVETEICFFTDLGRASWRPESPAELEATSHGVARRIGTDGHLRTESPVEKGREDVADPSFRDQRNDPPLRERGIESFSRTPRRPVVQLTSAVRQFDEKVETPDRQNLDYRARLGRLASRALLTVIDVGPEQWQNLALTNISRPEALVSVDGDTVLDAVVTNFGDQMRSNHPVELWVDDALVTQTTVDLPPRGQATVRFTHRFPEPGSRTVELRLATDRLEIDNHRWLSVMVEPHVRVLCVGSNRRDTHFLARALDPEQRGEGFVRPWEITEGELLDQVLGEFACIFLSNVAQFTRSEARLLDGYLKQGGSVVFFLGDRVKPQQYNRELGGMADGQLRILPVRIGEAVPEGQYSFDPLDYRHPVVRLFRGREQSGLLSTPIYKYLRMSILESSQGADVVLGFRNGDPAIVEERIHSGRSMVVATAASLSSVNSDSRTPWTILPTWPSFVPIVQELLHHSVAPRIEPYQVIVGQSIGTTMGPDAANTRVTIETPEDDRQRTRVELTADRCRWSCADTMISGIYTANYELPGHGTEHFAVNVDPKESDLTRISKQDLPPSIRVVSGPSSLKERFVDQAIRPRGAHRTILYTVLVMLLAESFLAWWFGRSRFATESPSSSTRPSSTRIA